MMQTSVTPELLPLTDTLLLLLSVKSHQPKLQSEAGLLVFVFFFYHVFVCCGVGVLPLTRLPQPEGDHRCDSVKLWMEVLGFN